MDNTSMPMREYLPWRLEQLKLEQQRVAGAIAEIERLQMMIAPQPAPEQESTPAAKKAK